MKQIFGKKGFTLVEVTLAVGITGLGLIALLGLMPQGLNMARESGNIMVELRIVQQLAGELRGTDWKQLVQYGTLDNTSGNRCYDDQAIEVKSEDPTNGTRISYVARVDFSSFAPRVPGATDDETSLRRVKIHVANVVNPGFTFSEDESHRFKTYSVLIPQTSPAF